MSMAASMSGAPGPANGPTGLRLQGGGTLPSQGGATGAAHAHSDPVLARQIELILERIDALPTLSQVATRAIELGSSDDVDMDELATLIESDPALASKIIGLCRRADKGLGDRVTTVRRAVLMLGLEAVRSAALSVAVYEVFPPGRDAGRAALDQQLGGLIHPDPNAPAFDRVGFWKHCIGVACAAELVAAGDPQLKVGGGEAFVCGLLHAIGRLALESLLPKAYDRAVRLAQARGSPMSPVERQLFGIDHHTVGRRLAHRWNLPQHAQEVVWLHDQPSVAWAHSPSAGLIRAVSAARALCRHLHLGFCPDADSPPDATRAWRELGVMAAPGAVARELHQRVADRVALLGLEDSSHPEMLLESLVAATTQLGAMHRRAADRTQRFEEQERHVRAMHSLYKRLDVALATGDTLEAVVASAHEAFGPGYYALLTQWGEDDAVRVHRFTPDGRLGDETSVQPPLGLRERFTLSSLASHGSMQVTTLGMLGWLADELADAPDVRTLRALGVPVSGAGNFRGAALVTDCAGAGGEGTSPGASSGAFGALARAWGEALRQAGERERAARTHEQLVQASRELTEAQARLAERETLARLGETTAGAAHEMNNPLMVIAGKAQVVLSRTRDQKDRAALTSIVEASRQLGELVTSLHILSTDPKVSEGTLDLPELIHRVVEKGRERTSPNADVSLELSRLPRLIVADPALIEGALVELVVNALEACPKGPVLVTGHIEPSDRSLVLRVIDAGPGLSEKARTHAFDPFFSERTAGRGRGLGLPRARMFARALDGAISLQSPVPHDPSRSGTLAILTVRRWCPGA